MLAFASIRHRRSPALPEKAEISFYEKEWWHSWNSPAAVRQTGDRYNTDLAREKWLFVLSLPSLLCNSPMPGFE